MKVIKQTGTANTTYSPGRQIKYLAIHYTAGVSCKSGSAASCASWFGNPNAGGSADYIVDEGGLVQYNPDPKNRYCWAVGGSKYNTQGGRLYGIAKNANCVSLEICSGNKVGKITYPNDPNYYFTTAVEAKAIEATKYLMELYGIDADHVIRHYDVNGKCCPGVIGWNKDSGSEDKWNAFHEAIGGAPIKWYRIRLAWDKPETQVGAYINLDKAKADCPAGDSVFDDTGKVVYTNVDAVSSPQSADKYPSGIPASKEVYINAVGSICQQLYPETKILPSVVAAQCCLETGFGLGGDSVPLMQVNNLLGMKTDLINSTWQQWSVWKGGSIIKRTPEYHNGQLVYINDSFRKYTDYENCIRDYEMFLLHVRNNKGLKYARIAGMTDPAQVIHAIRIGTGTDAHPEGYCTDPAYESKILSLIKQYNLTKYDTNVPTPQPEPQPQPKPEPQPQPTPTPSKKKYRVRVGIYKYKSYLDKLSKMIKDKTGLDCFSEQQSDGTHLYCGSFDSKANAEERAKLLAKAGFNSQIETVTI